MCDGSVITLPGWFYSCYLLLCSTETFDCHTCLKVATITYTCSVLYITLRPIMICCSVLLLSYYCLTAGLWTLCSLCSHFQICSLCMVCVLVCFVYSCVCSTVTIWLSFEMLPLSLDLFGELKFCLLLYSLNKNHAV